MSILLSEAKNGLTLERIKEAFEPIIVSSSPIHKQRDRSASPKPRSMDDDDEPLRDKKEEDDDSNLVKEEYWFANVSRDAATLLVRVPIYTIDKVKTRILSMHCVPIMLSSASPYFKTLVESDPTNTTITMPETFSYYRLFPGTLGTNPITREEVIRFFSRLHHGTAYAFCAERQFDLLQMAYYLDIEFILKQIDTDITFIINGPTCSGQGILTNLLWARHFKRDKIVDAVFAKITEDMHILRDIIKRGEFESLDKETLIKLLKRLAANA